MGRVFDYATGNFVRPYSQTGRLSLGLRPGVTLPRRPLTSLENAIGDLASNVPNGRKRATTSFQRGMIRGTRRASDHDAWRHSANMVARMLATPAGDCPAEGGGRGRNERYFSQAYARLHARGLARTITTNFHNPGSGRFTHYSEPRTLTLREALRIQSFPDDFSFEGIARVFKSDAERMIGNAFPRLLACQLARHVRTLLA